MSEPTLPDLRDAWLVVIDPQRVFADPESEWGSPMFGSIVGPVHHLAESFTPERTVVTRWLPGGREGSWSDYFERWPFADRPFDDPLFALVGQFEELTDRPTMDATTFGKWGADLERITGELPTLVLAGVSTDCCVISTALAAADDGVRVVIATDACAGSDETNHAAALRVMDLYAPQITLTTTSEILNAR